MSEQQAEAKNGIAVENVAFSYPDTIMHFDLAVPDGSMSAVLGPSGSGKTTLLNLVAGFENPESGAILIGGENVTGDPPWQRPVSMVFQEDNLFAHLNVESNVGLGVSPALRLSDDDRARVADALAQTGLSGKEKRLPRELSGGERQRVALARVLVRNRRVLLLDEPFASLGPALRAEMLDLVARLHKEHALTTLFVTHHPDDARRIADRIVFLEDGRVAAQGNARKFFGKTGPEAFLRYIGADVGPGGADHSSPA